MGCLSAGRLGTFGPPKCIQVDGGGEWENAIRTDSCAERRTKSQFQGVGTHPWLLGRRSGLARGIYNRLIEDGRFPNERMPSKVQWCLNTMRSASGFSAYQMAFGSNPVDFFGWEDGDEDILFARDTSLSG